MEKNDRGVDTLMADPPHPASKPDNTASAPAAHSRDAIVIARLTDLTGAGMPVIDLSQSSLSAREIGRSCVQLRRSDIGKDVVVALPASERQSPVILGVVRKTAAQDLLAVTIDGAEVSLCGSETITLRCGEASIVLNRKGKIVIRGVQVVSHASGANRIRGGSVEIN